LSKGRFRHAQISSFSFALRLFPVSARLLEENLGAASIELTADDLAEIERAAAEIHVEGERYPEHLMKTIGR